MSSKGSVTRIRDDLELAGEVSGALVARLQLVEQAGGELMAALPVHRPERVGVRQMAGAGSSTSGSVRRWWARKWPCSPATMPSGSPARRPTSCRMIAISTGWA